MKQKKQRIRKVICLLLFISLMVLVGCDSDSVDAKTNYKYNLTGMGNATGPVELMQLVNSELMHGLFGIEILIAVFVICFMAFMVSTGSGISAFAASSYISFVISIFLLGLNMIPPIAMIMPLLFSAISVWFIKDY